MRRPAARNASTTPAASGASGPTTVSAIALALRERDELGDRRSTATLVSAGSRAVPALPGATNTLRDARRLRELPGQRVLAAAAADDQDVHGCGRRSVPEVADAGEHHRDAALVGGGDHLVVAHAAARLDDGDRAVVGDDVEAVAEREERVRGDDRARQRQARVLRP